MDGHRHLRCWLSITSVTSGTNTGNIVCAFTANTGISSRTVTIRVTAASGIVGSPKDITITQMSTRIPIPDTGQIKCYDPAGNEIACPAPGQSFFGQDGNYIINPMSFTKLDNAGKVLPDTTTSWSMVKDSTTSLVRVIKIKKDGVMNYSDPHDADNTYTWYDNNPTTNGGNGGFSDNGVGTVSDAFTGLMWEKAGESNKTWVQALSYCEGLTLAGHKNWRLPTVKELQSLAEYSRIRPAIDTAYFPNTALAAYWASQPTSPPRCWDGGDFTYGFDYGYEKNLTYNVRAVRGGETLPALSVTPPNQDVAKESGTTTFSVANTGTGALQWTAAVTSGNDWLLISSGTSGVDTGTITCAFTANTASTTGTGSITITAAGAIGSPKVVPVTQARKTDAGQFMGV